jgi:hypothetical protein
MDFVLLFVTKAKLHTPSQAKFIGENQRMLKRLGDADISI